jgi:transcription-repair coupling factor (superfamily II helicase)
MENEGALDPMPSILPDGDAPIASVAAVATQALGGKPTLVSGAFGSAGAFVVARIAKSRPVVVITADAESARRFGDDVSFLGVVGDVAVMPGYESTPYADVSPDRRGAMARLSILSTLDALASYGERLGVLVVPVSALVRRTVPRAVVRAHTAQVVAEEELERDRFLSALSEAGYLRVPVVEDPGSFAVRGSVIDVWPGGQELPTRIELYGDMVVSLKDFDPYEQKTQGSTRPSLACAPVREAILAKELVAAAKSRVAHLCDALDYPTTKARGLADDVASARAFFGADGFLPAYYTKLDTLFDYLPKDAVFAVEEPDAVVRAVHEELDHALRDQTAKGKAPHFPLEDLYVGESFLREALIAAPRVGLAHTVIVGGEEGGLGDLFADAAPLELGARDHEDLTRATKRARSAGKTGSLAPLVRRIRHFRDSGLRVFVTARTEVQGERIAGLLGHQKVRCETRFEGEVSHHLDDASSRDVECTIVTGSLTRGVLLPAEGLAIITEEEIFGTRAKRTRERKSDGNTRPFLEDLRSLATGDFVVHAEHGIGRYHGLIHRDVGGTKVDLLVVEYAGGDKLYLPVYRLNQVQKYSGGEHAEPKIDRLGGQSFAKTKGRVKKAVREMADELLRLYAERESAVAERLPEPSDEYYAFEATFPFDETPDQAKAIQEVNKDFERGRPMDRLVCGDVGFGKTEVALRAAFRAAMEGKQVCVLCPTTVLAQQHFRVFEQRMQSYPIRIRSMSRFQTKKEQDETLAMLKDGSCDIVVGTHRLLSKDVHFKNLGFLVVDEEQRFGVTHKERIKQMKAQVHVLTLSATPIPRTLQMAVSGLRDLSLITTPPVDRRAVRTVVTRYDDAVLREAVERELSRGGQIFYVYNRIEGIYERAQKLQALVPNARIAVGHGQMAKAGSRGGSSGTDKTESALEKTMLDFVDGRYDILVATAIVESGLDIPRANTILIDRADMFGLSQLYQLRGRVGRSKERAYCYLIVPPVDALKEEARARIEALERHTELGSGFKIASLDLELRGAGDLLGAEQSGNVASVGFDLFVQMLEDAVSELRGEEVVHEVDTELSFDVEAILPEEYIADVGVRLSFYKRLASAQDEAHVTEIGEELEDRFGAPPEAAKRLLALMALKTELRRLRVLGCEATATRVTLHLREDTPLDPQKILNLVRAPKSPYKLTPDMRLTRRFEGPAETRPGTSIAHCEALLGELAKCMKTG